MVRIKKVRSWATGGLIAGLLATATSFAADYAVVANKGVGSSSLSKSDAQAIFSGEKSKWDDGKPIKIVVLQGGGASKSFLQDVVGKTPSQFDTYWKKLVFTGKAGAPKTFDDPDALVSYVSGTAGAIGFVGAGQAGGSVKTISIR